MLYKLTFTITILFSNVLYGQVDANFCGKFNEISLTYLELDSTGQFVHKEYYRFHDQLIETIEVGTYSVQKDTMYFTATTELISINDKRDYDYSKEYIGLKKRSKLAFGTLPPYTILRPCSQKKIERLKRNL